MKEYTQIKTDKIKGTSKDSIINLVLETLNNLKKQVLIFNNSKRSSESTAEKIAKEIIENQIENKVELNILSHKILKTFPNPTKQCIKLSNCIKKGVAFHHSGLVSKQRDIVEKGFKDGIIKIISSTPTLAAGLNLPAYKVIVKDYKRYSSRGFNDIPVLEYHQMSGRAGRPGKEKEGISIICVNNQNEMERIIPKFIHGKPEEILSKLAVEPILKMHILSLISMDLINTKKEIKEFFSNTFYAKQYQNLEELNYNIFRIINILVDYGFINQDDDYYMSTRLGKKISELYLNPDTANFFLENLDVFFKLFSNINYSKYDIYSLVHFLTNTIEMKPLFRVKKIEEDKYLNKMENSQEFLVIKFDPFEDDLEHYLSTLKTTDILIDWINEFHEDYISEKYGITPGELNYKIEIIDWLLYSLEEISLLKKNSFFKNQINKLRSRFKSGVKLELLPLIAVKGIGRVRARKLYNAGIKTLNDLRTIDINDLKKIISEKLAINIKNNLSSGIQDIDDLISKKPKEIKNREVSDIEVIDLVETYNEFEKEKQEKQRSLSQFF